MGRRVIALLLVSLVCKVSHASPWIGTTDPQLHYDLQTLVDHGYLDNAATTFPVPWKGIARQLQRLQLENLPHAAKVAANRLTHYARHFRKGTPIASMTAYGSNNRSRFASFDGQQGEKARYNLSSDFSAGRVAVKLSYNALPGGRSNFDQSFIAYQMGDWNLRAGAIDQWWGPGHATSLVLTNNARPIKAVSISRSTSDASELAVFNLLGPWYWTAQVGQLEEDVSVENAKIWSSRLTMKPIKNLELGLSWVATWGGRSGVTDSLGEFFDVVTLQKRCLDQQPECTDKDYVGEHLSAADGKYTFTALGRPISLYGQFAYEGKSSEFNSNNKLHLWGISTFLWDAKVYFESSDTNLACTDAVVSLATCFYENGTYSSAYRFYSQAIGGQYDLNASMTAIGMLKHYSDGDVLELGVRHIRLDDEDANSAEVSALQGQEIVQFSGYYQTVYRDWQVKLGAVIDHNQSDNQSSDTDYNVFAEIKYSF